MLSRRMRLEDKEREEGGENIHTFGSEPVLHLRHVDKFVCNMKRRISQLTHACRQNCGHWLRMCCMVLFMQGFQQQCRSVTLRICRRN